jgi:Fe-S-cluster containining protein
VTSDKELVHPATPLYRDLLRQIDSWFAEATARNPGVVPCRSGCSACCHGPFDISVADALLVREAFTRLPPAEQLEISEQARRQVARMREIEPRWRLEEGLEGITEDAFDRIADTLSTEPCPLLNQAGDCRIYSDRPMICRMMGLGITTPAGRVIENSCPIAGNFPEYAALPAQPFELEAMEEIEHACLEAASVESFGTPARAHFETTIALALTAR